MKNWSLLVAIVSTFALLPVADLQAQNYQKANYSDTIDVYLGDHSILTNKDVFIGKIEAYDPEGNDLAYFMIDMSNKPLFTINTDNGTIYTKQQYLPKLCSMGTYKLTIWVKDELFFTSADITINFNCD